MQALWTNEDGDDKDEEDDDAYRIEFPCSRMLSGHPKSSLCCVGRISLGNRSRPEAACETAPKAPGDDDVVAT